MNTSHKVVLATLGVLIIALGIMLVIGVVRGDDTHTDKDNSDVKSNTSQVVGQTPPRA